MLLLAFLSHHQFHSTTKLLSSSTVCYRPKIQHIKNVISHWLGGEGKLSNEGMGPGVRRRTENHLFPVHRAHPYCSALVKTHTVISPCLFAGLFNVASVSDLMCESYLIFVIFFTRAKFWRIKFTPKKRVNYDKIHRNLPIFCGITAKYTVNCQFFALNL